MTEGGGKERWWCAGCGSTFEERPGVSCPNCPYVALVDRYQDTGNQQMGASPEST